MSLRDATSRVAEALSLMAERMDVIQDTHGNVSQRFTEPKDKNTTVRMVIKPSGVPYKELNKSNLSQVVFEKMTDLPVEQRPEFTPTVKSFPAHIKPSVDAFHHATIYFHHPEIGAICHTHSPHVVAFAISELDIPCVSTEQADYFGGPIRCLPYSDLNSWGAKAEIRVGEKAVLLGHHGLLTFGKDAVEAVNLALAAESAAQKQVIAQSLLLRDLPELPQAEVDKWHVRYSTSYGQKK